MSEKFFPVPIDQLLGMILAELNNNDSIFGIEKSLFFNPTKNRRLNSTIFGQNISTPLGVAAGPHTQMAQNIIASWLMGCRYIELKTIQTLDELEVSKPCIDMQDEGYNCEWSQELKIEQSFNEYLNAWIIIHILSHKLAFGNVDSIFNMSVGYNLEGIKKPNVQWFFDKMNCCSAELAEKIEAIKNIYPEVVNLNIPHRLSNNITLSTMHGCPADEIEVIAKYLLEEKHLHTFVKLNPTLLGDDELRNILNSSLGFKTNVPDIAFEHDLKYPDAVKIITSLRNCANKQGLTFGLKLTNTLESVNTKNIFNKDVDMMYMSGRALHPVSINLARKLQDEFNDELLISFSAGANAFNIADTLLCGFRTVTVSSDLLRPGGYRRLNQYTENLNSTIESSNTGSLTKLIEGTNTGLHLQQYAIDVLTNSHYINQNLRSPSIKTSRKLNYFDCISAPCVDTCPTNQAIPQYMYHTANGEFDKALEVILRTNPFPSITGMVCDHQCQSKCTRLNYDNSLQIKEIKRFIAENASIKLSPKPSIGKSVAIVGAGPSGLSCAFYLAMEGFKVDVFEAHSKAGGMVKYAIPGFRLTDDAIDRDFDRLKQIGVNINYNHKVNATEFTSLKTSYSYVYLSPGAQKASGIDIEGTDVEGVYNPLSFLFGVKEGRITKIGNKIVVIGGGNTAMDTARTALRLTKAKGIVTIVYRRTIEEMPADQAEIKAALCEGIDIVELTAPEKVITKDNTVKGLICSKMKLEGLDSKGRPKPVVVPNSQFTIECDTIIPAVGQTIDIDFASPETLNADTRTYQTLIENVYIGGDALRGASTAINAIADGRKAANQIIKAAILPQNTSSTKNLKHHSTEELMLMRSKRIFSDFKVTDSSELPDSFNPVSATINKEQAIAEANRCLNCDEICNICSTVCPNLANRSYHIEPVHYEMQRMIVSENGKVEFQEDVPFIVAQQNQIINIANFCNECGNCASFCPTSSAPFQSKPKLHITTESFNKCNEGYMLLQLDNAFNLIYKENGSIKTLTERGDTYIYETDFVLARFEKGTFKLIEAKAKTPCVRLVQFQHASEMSIIMQGAKTCMAGYKPM